MQNAIAPAAAVQVRIGEIRVASSGLLKATLGSCVGIALLHRKLPLFGLAHCLLPEARPDEVSLDGRYADRAVGNLLSAMRVDPLRPRELRAVLGGGGRVVLRSAQIGGIPIGKLNLEAARKALRLHGIPFEELEHGGHEGCRVVLDCDAQAVSISRIHSTIRDAETKP